MNIKNIKKTINKYYQKNITNNYHEYFYDDNLGGYILKVYTNKDKIHILFDNEEDIILEDIRDVNEIKRYLNIPLLYQYKEKYKNINDFKKGKFQNILHEYYQHVIENNSNYEW